MSRFSIRNPSFIIVVCLLLAVIGVTSFARMPVDLFPAINPPEVVVATFYSGMPPEDIETDITDPLERFFTLASGIDHMESRSLLGVSIIKVFFQPGTAIDKSVVDAELPPQIRVNLRGMVEGMEQSFKSFGAGLILSFILLYLILIAQFRSFLDPFLIMLAIPMGFIGVLVILPLTHTTLNVMSLMGVLMLVGIADSNSILIVDFAHKLEEQGLSVDDAVINACRVRLRPILMTSLATIIGMIPMAMKLGTGAEQYAPMARAIIGGLTSSVALTVFIVPAAYVLVYRRRRTGLQPAQNPEIA